MEILRFLLFVSLAIMAQGQGTEVGFYSTTCPRVELTVQSAVQSATQSNPAVVADLLRMFFHDCFVNGCDGSILIDGLFTEKTAPPNLPLKGFEVIDSAKSQLETACPGMVSCADILALVARDVVVSAINHFANHKGGGLVAGGASWLVPLGRRDGLRSQASDTTNLPAFNDPISVQIRKFNDKGLNTQDLVTLVGGHTIGTAAGAVFSYRLYNFNNTNAPDPDINPAFLPQLRAVCPNAGDGSTSVDLDTGSVDRFDTSFYSNLRDGRGVLESDAKLWSDPTTQTFVQQFLGIPGVIGLRFNVESGRSMVKMGNIDLKTGSQGEIRRVCSAIN